VQAEKLMEAGFDKVQAPLIFCIGQLFLLSFAIFV
jgi:hypothetical protein